MSDFDRYTRVNKFEKRRKNTKLMSLLIVAGSFLIILLIGLWIFGPDDEQEQPNNLAGSNDESTENEDLNEEDGTEAPESGQDSTETEESSSQIDENQDNDTDSSNESNDEIESEIGEKEQVDPTGDDANVIEAYTQNWQPIGTEQEGPHTMVFDEGSQDRMEMEKALSYATSLPEGEMITWWLQRDGDQKVIGTISDRAETQIFRVYISWVENQGWQPTLVEALIENDQKWRFE
jgi:hypothetical protein